MMNFIIKQIAKVLTLSFIAVLSGCGENPLIGEWNHVSDTAFRCKVIKFTSEREFCDSMSYEVTYEIYSSSVMVKPDQKSALLPVDISYSVLSEDVISYTSPFSKKEILIVRKGATDITKEAIQYYQKFSLSELEKSCSSGPVKVEHSSEYWSKTVPEQIHNDMCKASELKKKA